MKKIFAYLLILQSLIVHAQISQINNSLDTLWNTKLKLYEKSKTQFLRTKVVYGSKGITEILKDNRRVLLDVDEIFIKNYSDVLYNVKYDSDVLDEQYGRSLITNYTGHIGLEMKNSYVRGQLSENLFFFNFTELVFDSKLVDWGYVRLPKQHFLFDKITPFPYLLLSYRDYLFSPDYKSRGNEKYRPSANSSDLIFNLSNQNISHLESWGNEFDLTFGSSQVLCKLGNDIFSIHDLKKIELDYDRNEQTNESEYVPATGEFRKRNVFAPIITFNDSIFISHYKLNNLLVKYNLNTKVIDTIQLAEIIDDNRWDSHFEYAEIDRFGKYLYLEFKRKIHLSLLEEVNLLAIYDCQLNRLVYLGPFIGIDYTSEKLGWVMTKAIMKELPEKVLPSPTNKQFKKYNEDFQWIPVNFEPPVAKSNGGWTSVKQVNVIERFLLNLNPLINEDFEKDLEKLIIEKSPVEDFFNNDLVSTRKLKLKDSLITVSNTWSKYKSIVKEYDLPRKKTDNDTLEIEDLQLLLNGEGGYKESEITLIPRLLELKNENSSFIFDLIIDSIPMSYSENTVVLPNENGSIYRNDNVIGQFLISSNPFERIDSALCNYRFSVKFDDGEIARKFNQLLTNLFLLANYRVATSEESILNSCEYHLISIYLDSSNINSNHYWNEIRQKCIEQGISQENTTLEISIIDNEKWVFPILFQRPTDLVVKPKY